MSPLLQDVLKQVEQLTAEERLELIQKVAAGLKTEAAIAQPRPKWSDLRGMAPYPLMGEDAQEWVSRTRQESDAHREQVLKGNDAD
jgi:hypothetical protein